MFSRELPEEALIGNAYLVPRLGRDWVYITQEPGRADIPGGKKEPGELHHDALARELLEEAGAEVLDTSLVGYWLLESKLAHAPRPHLPHPHSAAVVLTGQVRLVGTPTNPAGSRRTKTVEVAPLSTVVDALNADGRADLAQLYVLVSTLTD